MFFQRNKIESKGSQKFIGLICCMLMGSVLLMGCETNVHEEKTTLEESVDVKSKSEQESNTKAEDSDASLESKRDLEENALESRSDAVDLKANNEDEILEDSPEEKYMAFLNGDIKSDFSGEVLDINELGWFEFGTPRYAIYDLNEDGTQELLIKSWSNWLNVLYYENNSVMGVDTPFYTGATGETVLENGKVILEDNNHAGRHSYVVYNYEKDNTFSEICAFSHWYPDENGIDSNEYYYSEGEEGEDKNISKEEYFEQLDYLRNENTQIEWKIVPGYEIENNLTSSPFYTHNKSIAEYLYDYVDQIEYEGDMGELFDEYKNLNLSADEQGCRLERIIEKDTYSLYYRMWHGDKLLFETGKVDYFPNALGMLYFEDTNNDGNVEVLYNYYVDSTGGWLVTASSLFEKNEKGEWAEKPIYIYAEEILADSALENMVLDVAATKREFYNIRDIVMKNGCINMLIDFGMKDGPNIILDYDYLTVPIQDGDNKAFWNHYIGEVLWPFDAVDGE